MDTRQKQLIEGKLTSHARNFLRDNYNMPLLIPIKINGRLKRALGHFKYNNVKNKSISIDISRELIELNDFDKVIDILNHELVHYAMYEKGLPFSDGDRHFENELKRLNVVSQDNIFEVSSKKHVYQCESCGAKLKRTKRLNTNKYCCGRCTGNLKYIGIVHV